MFQQAAHIGVVHALGRRANPEGRAQFLIVEHAKHQLAPGRVAEFLSAEGQQLVQHFVQGKWAGGQQRGLVHSRALLFGERAQLFHRELDLVPVEAGAAFGPDHGAHGNVAELRAERMPDLGLQAAAGVGQGQPPVGPVARLALGRLTDHEQAARLGGRADVFDVRTFFHILSALRRATGAGLRPAAPVL